VTDGDAAHGGDNRTVARARGPGAPCKLTDEVHKQIVAHLRIGAYVETAAAAAGIVKSTFYDWLRRGETGEEPFASFSADVARVTAEVEIELLCEVRTGDKDRWRSAMTLLERKFPKRWGQRTELTLKNSDSPTKEAFDALTDDELEAELRKALASGGENG
jgi:transposase